MYSVFRRVLLTVSAPLKRDLGRCHLFARGRCLVHLLQELQPNMEQIMNTAFAWTVISDPAHAKPTFPRRRPRRR